MSGTDNGHDGVILASRKYATTLIQLARHVGISFLQNDSFERRKVLA
jgi:hypothetical protein